MIEERARVVAMDEQGVWVEAQRQSACGQCAANKGCGTAVIGKVLGQKRSRVRVDNPANTLVAVGDEVLIGVNEELLVRGSFAVYIVPLLALFLFALLGQTLSAQLALAHDDVLSAVGGLLGLVVGFAWVRRFARGDARYQPVIVANVTPSVSFH